MKKQKKKRREKKVTPRNGNKIRRLPTDLYDHHHSLITKYNNIREKNKKLNKNEFIIYNAQIKIQKILNAILLNEF